MIGCDTSGMHRSPGEPDIIKMGVHTRNCAGARARSTRAKQKLSAQIHQEHADKGNEPKDKTDTAFILLGGQRLHRYDCEGNANKDTQPNPRPQRAAPGNVRERQQGIPPPARTHSHAGITPIQAVTFPFRLSIEAVGNFKGWVDPHKTGTGMAFPKVPPKIRSTTHHQATAHPKTLPRYTPPRYTRPRHAYTGG